MNREIKFRALKDDMSNCNWVYGQLVYDASGTPRITEIDKSGQGLTFHTCIKGTEGQYTGLKDKNDKEIYEGDIAMFHYFYMSFGANMGAQESEHELTGIVQWQEYGYGLSAIKGEHWVGYTGYSDGEGYSDFLHLVGMSESSIHEESFEVIGNIHDNPELIHPTTVNK